MHLSGLRQFLPAPSPGSVLDAMQALVDIFWNFESCPKTTQDNGEHFGENSSSEFCSQLEHYV